MAKKKEEASHAPAAPAAPAATTTTATHFLSAYTHYIRLDIQTKHDPSDDHARLVRWLRLTSIAFCILLTSRLPGLRLVTWPRLFVVSDEEAALSSAAEQLRGSFLIGVQLPPGAIQASYLRRIRQSLDGYTSWIRRKGIWTDELVEPMLEARCVQATQLGQLVEDRHMWSNPQTKKAKPMAFEGGHIATDAQTTQELASLSATVMEPSLPPAAEQPQSTKFPAAFDVLHRLKWDDEYDITNFAVVYEDRFTGFHEMDASAWNTESTSDVFIPQHRIRSFLRKSTREVVWHRTKKTCIF